GWEALLRRAWGLVSAHTPTDAATCAAVWSGVTPLRPLPGDHLSAASGHAPGAIGMAWSDDPVHIAESIVHESHHLVLGALTGILPLHGNDPSPRYRVPWRSDPRPLGAALQGVYAHLAVARWWREYAAAVPTAARRRCLDTHRQYREWVLRTLDVLEGCVSLTPAGERFLGGMAEEAARLDGPSGRSRPTGSFAPAGTVPSSTADAPTVHGGFGVPTAIGPGDVLLVHASLRALGSPSPRRVADVLLDLLGTEGTLVVPSFTPDNTDPEDWERTCGVAVPRSWWPGLRNDLPPFDPMRTPGHRTGAFAEYIRTLPGSVRSNHPHTSFTAVGREAGRIANVHDLNCHFGERSPLGTLYALDAKVLLLGTDFASNTAFHLAEYRYAQPPPSSRYRCVIPTPEKGRTWVDYRDVRLDDRDFPSIGMSFEATGAVRNLGIAGGRGKVFRLRDAVRFAEEWMRTRRAHGKGNRRVPGAEGAPTG
ncbi:AAC(3) family N-acetyltransferase, partial [Streptomyces calidiresistens]